MNVWDLINANPIIFIFTILLLFIIVITILIITRNKTITAGPIQIKNTKEEKQSINIELAVREIWRHMATEHPIDNVLDDYKSDVKTIVLRTINEIVAIINSIAKKHIYQKCSCSNIEDASHIYNEFKSASEILRVTIMRIYMASIDANGFCTKTEIEWKCLIVEIFMAINTSISINYDMWYNETSVPYNDIYKEFLIAQTELYEIHSALMNRIKNMSIERDKSVTELEIGIKEKISTLIKGCLL